MRASTNPPASLWRNRNYLLLWSGQIISSIGTQVSDLAFPLLVLALTNSPVQAGLVGASSMLPYLIFSLPAGALVDRWNRKLVMILCDTARALSLASIPLALALHRLTVLQLYIVALIEGTLFVFFNIAEVASLPHVVRKEQFPTVAAQTEFTNSMSFLLGRSLGGVLYGLGRLFPFLTDAISYLVSVLSLFAINIAFQEKRATAPRKLWAEIWEGLRWLLHQPLLCFIALLGCVVHIAGSGMTLMVIVLAQQQHASAFLIGLILGAGGIGTLVGALLGGVLQKRYCFARLTILTQWLSALLFPLYLLLPGAVGLATLVLTLSAVMTIYGVIQFGYRLSLIPDELQGRVNSVFRLVLFAGDPLGLAVAGFLLQSSGAILTVILFSAILLLFAIATTLNRPLRNAPPLAELTAK